jgi:hypothetical protein
MISCVDLKDAQWENRDLRRKSMEAVMIFFACGDEKSGRKEARLCGF